MKRKCLPLQTDHEITIRAEARASASAVTVIGAAPSFRQKINRRPWYAWRSGDVYSVQSAISPLSSPSNVPPEIWSEEFCGWSKCFYHGSSDQYPENGNCGCRNRTDCFPVSVCTEILYFRYYRWSSKRMMNAPLCQKNLFSESVFRFGEAFRGFT